MVFLTSLKRMCLAVTAAGAVGAGVFDLAAPSSRFAALSETSMARQLGSCPGVQVLVQNYCFLAATSCTQSWTTVAGVPIPSCCTGTVTINTVCNVEAGPVGNGGSGSAINIRPAQCVGTYNTGPCLCGFFGNCYAGAPAGPFTCGTKNIADSC
jgi:hypothetical protein